MFSEKRKRGNLGEDIAIKFLLKNLYLIIERNYLKRIGEIDIIAKKGQLLHFIEVKSAMIQVSHETIKAEDLKASDFSVLEEKDDSVFDPYLLEENVSYKKRKKFARVIRFYLSSHRISQEVDFSIDILAILIDFASMTARIRFTENVSLF